jgi:putative ABC transport system permease protein
MITIAFRDLQWRLRRIIVAIIGASFVLALALIMSGLSAGFENESARTVSLAKATGWIVDQNGTGPFLQPTPLLPEQVAAAQRSIGEAHAVPIVFTRQSVTDAKGKMLGKFKHINLVGVVPGQLGSPSVGKGKPLRDRNEAVVDSSLGAAIGDRIRVGAAVVTVVGTVTGARLLAGVPNVYIPINDARLLTFSGQKLSSAILVDRPIEPPLATKLLTNDQAITDGLLPIRNAQKTISMVRSLLWLVAALIVGSIMYLGALERTKDVAVMKAMGATSRSIGLSLAVQAILLALAASAIGAVLARLIAPAFPISSEIPAVAFATLPLLAIIVAAVASLGAARRLFAVQPALAFGA